MRYIIIFTTIVAGVGYAQEQAGPEAAEPAKPAVEKPAPVAVDPGTRIPLSMINSISTKSTVEGDRVYLETVFPITNHGRIVIPAGSFVNGTVTQVKRAGRIKGRAELYVRFDSLTLPNGVTRDFRARIGAMDGTAAGKLDRSEGRISGDGNKGGDARTIAETAGAGASVGAIAGGLGGHPGSGLGMGAAGGAAAGLVGVLLSRGPDAVLTKGTTVDMVLDRRLEFEESELQFAAASAARRSPPVAEAAPSKKENQNRRLWPLPF